MALLTVMLFVPPYLQVAGWEAGFGLQGWFCRFWFPGSALAVLSGWRGVLWIQTLVNVPWIVLIVGVSLTSMPAELEEQASLYGAPWRVLRHVTLPMMGPALIASGLVVLLLAASDITVTDVYQIRTFAEEIYTGFALGDTLRDVPLRTMPGMLLLSGLVLGGLLAGSQISRNLNSRRRGDGWRIALERRTLPIWIALGLLLALLVAVPLASLIYQAGLKVTSAGSERIRHWSLLKAVAMLATSPARFGQEYAWSFLLAQLTSISVLIGAILLAWASQMSWTVRLFAWGLLLLGWVLPGPFVALVLGRLLNQPNSPWLFYLYDRTLLLPWLTLSLRLFPFAYLIVEMLVRRLPRRPFDIARTEGANRRQLLAVAVWPQIGPAVAWLWLVLVALAVADLSATILAVPPGVTTVAIRIFNLVHYGVADQLAGLCLGTVMLFGSLAGLVIGFWPARLGRSDARL